MLTTGQFFAFVIGIAAMVLLVPGAVWAATGSWVQAKYALRRYSMFLLALAVLVALGAVLALVAPIFSS